MAVRVLLWHLRFYTSMFYNFLINLCCCQRIVFRYFYLENIFDQILVQCQSCRSFIIVNLIFAVSSTFLRRVRNVNGDSPEWGVTSDQFCLLARSGSVVSRFFSKISNIEPLFFYDTILRRYGYSILIRYRYFAVIKFPYRYWYWYFSAIKFRYRYWYWYFHQMDWYPIWYQNLLEIAIFLPKNQWNQSF